MMESKEISYQEDFSWVKRIFDGDAEAWNGFVNRFSDRVWRRSWQLCYEACPFKQGGVFCVFHALNAGGVQPVDDERPSCDEGLEIYAFIFDYLYKREQESGKLKYYDGRSKLDTFVSAVLHGHLRTDWIRHRRRLRVDQITLPAEIQRLPKTEQQVFEQMVMQRPTETIARNLNLPVEETERAQERVTHALIANGNLHLILRNPEGSLEDFDQEAPETAPRIIPMQRSIDRIWERVCELISGLPEPQKVLLDMVFEKELDARTMLERTQQLQLKLPVVPVSGNMTIHTIYQSIDYILREVGRQLAVRYPELLEESYTWLDDDSLQTGAVSIQGLKALLKNMGLTRPDAPSLLQAANE